MLGDGASGCWMVSRTGRSKRLEWLHHLRGQVGAAERQGLVSSSPMFDAARVTRSRQTCMVVRSATLRD